MACRVRGRGYRLELTEMREAGRTIGPGRTSTFSGDERDGAGPVCRLNVRSGRHRVRVLGVGLIAQADGISRAFDIGVHDGHSVSVGGHVSRLRGGRRPGTTEAEREQHKDGPRRADPQ